MKFSKSKKITIASIISIAFITIALIIASQSKTPQTEEEKVEEPITEIVEAEKDEVLEEEVEPETEDVTEEKTETEEVVEEVKEEDSVEKPQNAPETSKNESETNNTTQVETKPQSLQNSSNSTTTNQSSNSTTTSKPSSAVNNSSSSSSNSSNSTSSSNNSSNSNTTTQTKPETSTPAPVPTPEPQPVKVTGVTTSTANLTLEIGGTGKMTATVSPSNADNKAVTFSSSNTAVATVDQSGNIVAKGSGTAYITATSKENSKMSASIVVTVKEKPKTAVYTGDSIVARLRNEKGWYGSGTYAYLAPSENSAAELTYVEVSSAKSTGTGIDTRITVYNSQVDGVVSGVEQVIRWIMPNQGQQVINKLHDSSYYGGTLEGIDGRKVVISLKNYGIVIDIYAKYE